MAAPHPDPLPIKEMGRGKSKAAAADGEAGELPFPTLQREGAEINAPGAMLVLHLQYEEGGRLEHGTAHTRPEAGETIEAGACKQGTGQGGGRLLQIECRSNRPTMETAIPE